MFPNYTQISSFSNQETKIPCFCQTMSYHCPTPTPTHQPIPIPTHHVTYFAPAHFCIVLVDMSNTCRTHFCSWYHTQTYQKRFRHSSLSFSTSSFGSMITICRGWCQSLPALFLEHGQTLGAIPLALGLVAEVHAPKVEPLDGTILVVAPNHLTVGHLQLTTVYISLTYCEIK